MPAEVSEAGVAPGASLDSSEVHEAGLDSLEVPEAVRVVIEAAESLKFVKKIIPESS